MSSPFAKTPLRDSNRNQSQNNKELHISRELMDMKKKLDHERAKSDDLELEIKSKDALVKKLTEENEFLKKRVRLLNDEMANSVSLEVLDKVKIEFEEYKAKHEVVLGDLKFSQNQVKDLEEELKASWNSNQELSIKFESAKTDMGNLAREFVDYTELKAENEELKQSLEALKEQRREEVLNESSLCLPLNLNITGQDTEPVPLFTEMMSKDIELDLEKTKEEKEKLKVEVEELRTKVTGMEVLQRQLQTLSSQLNYIQNRLSDSNRKLRNFLNKREADETLLPPTQFFSSSNRRQTRPTFLFTLYEALWRI